MLKGVWEFGRRSGLVHLIILSFGYIPPPFYIEVASHNNLPTIDTSSSVPANILRGYKWSECPREHGPMQLQLRQGYGRAH